jgi:hypothetical protein
MYSRKNVTFTEKGKYRVRTSKRAAQLGKDPLTMPAEAEYSVSVSVSEFTGLATHASRLS